MKILFLLFCASILTSCADNPADFKGFGQLVLGAQFSTVDDHDKFDSPMPDEHFIGTYKLSGNLGTVSNVNVTTRNGRISEVMFTTTPSTSVGRLEEILADLNQVDNDPRMPKLPVAGQFRAYARPDDSVFVAVIEKDSYKGFAPDQYVYQDRAALLEKFSALRKRLQLGTR